MTIDNAMLAYHNRPLAVPAGLQGSGAKIMPNEPIDKGSALYEQCLEFESIFVQMMLKEMRSTVQKSGLLDGGHAEEIFEDMLYQERASSMSKTANFGLADSIYRELSRGH